MNQLLEKIKKARTYLSNHKIDGWLLYSFQNSNDICSDFLLLPNSLHQTRRFFYFIANTGEMVAVVHFIEKHLYSHLPGEIVVYKSAEELDRALEKILKKWSKICMEYSPENRLPYLSKVDAGTLEKIRSFDVEVISSGELLGSVFSILSEEEYVSHLRACQHLEEIVGSIPSYIKSKSVVYERDLQHFILEAFHDRDLVTEGEPICASGENSSNPHYQITGPGKKIEKDQILLVDLWAKLKHERAIFADTTKMFYFSQHVEDKIKHVFSIVRKAQLLAIEFIKKQLSSSRPVKGYEVDKIARDWIVSQGLGDYFVHRLGHNIETQLHGRGTHLDSFETIDDRIVQAGSLFSIEPGVYLPGEFGVRLELNAYIDHQQIKITTQQQDDFISN